MQTEHKDDRAPDVLADVKETARSEVEDAKVRLSRAADRVRDEARNAGSTLSTLVIEELDRRAENIGQQLRVVASRLRGEKTEQGSDEPAPLMAEQAADLVDDLSHRMEGGSMRDLGDRIERYGRENPALFFLGCLVTGAIVGRMIVATSDAQDKGDFDSGKSGFLSARDMGRDQSAGSGRDYGSTWDNDAPGADPAYRPDDKRRWDEAGSMGYSDRPGSGPDVKGTSDLQSGSRPGSGSRG